MNSPNNRRTKSRFWPWIIGGFFLLIAMWHLFASFYREEEKVLRRELRETVIENFPEQSAEFLQTFGLFPFVADRDSSSEGIQNQRAVVLVHGLDDPGKVWQNLAPELVKQDFNVWLMHYPNDQPVEESAQMLFEELKRFKSLDIQRISIVAHSMGGLVSREMLTSPEIDYHRSAKNGQVPEVATLIMVGTPNHGSQMARFRAFAVVRDQVARLTKGEAAWLGAILDGAGEAKIDLLPESRFLTELNTRPHPEGVKQLVIAGIVSPWDERDINHWVENISPSVPEDWQKQVDELGKFMISMTYGLGDGLVTVESTRLKGVPHRTVAGSHLSMIRNITTGSQHIPPAVPLIVDRLKKGE